MPFTDSLTDSFTSGFVRPFNGKPIEENLYTLLDTFAAAFAAGSVNGTFCDTGQIRFVTDGNSKLSITANNTLSVATGGAGTGSPGLWYPSFSRTSGLVFLCNLTLADTASNIAAGWDSNQSGASLDAITFAGGALTKVITGGSPLNFGTGFAASATTYDIAVILRAAGAFYFVKGGVFTNWTLMWSSGTAVNSPMFPVIQQGGGTTTVFTANGSAVSGKEKGPRVPLKTYLPMPSASDSFARANGALGSTNGLGAPEANGGNGLAWTGSTFAIASNAAVNTPTTGSDVAVNGGFSADTDWAKGTGWTIAAGLASKAVGTQSDITETTGAASTLYLVTYTVSNYASGTFTALAGTNTGTGRSANGTYAELIYANGTTIGVRATNTAVGSIDNVSYIPYITSSLFASVSGQSVDSHVVANVTVSGTSFSGGVISLDSASNPQNYVLFYHDGTNAHLEKYVAGARTSLINTAATYNAGAPIQVVKFGTSYILYYNNAIVSTQQTVSDAGIISNTLDGIYSTASSNTCSNFVTRPLGSNNEYSGLDLL